MCRSRAGIAPVIDDLVALEVAELRLREQLRQLRIGQLVHREAIGETARDGHHVHSDAQATPPGKRTRRATTG